MDSGIVASDRAGPRTLIQPDRAIERRARCTEDTPGHARGPTTHESKFGVERIRAIGDLDELSRTTAKFNCKSKVEDLNVQVPRNILQPTCVHTLFDSGCGLSKASFAVSGTVQAGSTVNKLLTTLVQADAYFDNGQLVFTSGANNGHLVAVKKYLNSGETVYFVVPLPAVPNVADTFTIYPGCDKTQATCAGKFSNLVNFGGFPYVPAPETAI